MKKYKYSKFRFMKDQLIADYKELQTAKKVAEKYNVSMSTIKKWFEFHEITERHKYI